MLPVLAVGLLVAAEPPDVRFASALLAQAFAAQPHVSVVTNEDVRRAMDLEADRQAGRCTSVGSNSCLAEIAAALDARLVVFGAVDGLEDGYLVELNVFDAKAATSVVRESARATSRSGLADVMEERGWRLAAATRARFGDEELRVMVLDIEARGEAVSSSAPVPWGWIGVAGLSVLAAGGIVGGVACDATSASTFQKANDDAGLSAEDLRREINTSDAWAAGAVASYSAGVLLLGGAAAMALWGTGE